MQIHTQIRQRRRALGIKLKDLAANLNISASYLSQIEQGKQNITLELLYRILHILKLKLKLEPMQFAIKMKNYNSKKAEFEIEFEDDASQNEAISVVSNFRDIKIVPTEAEYKNRQYGATALRALAESGEDPQHFYLSNFPKDGDLEWTSNTPVPVVVFARDREDAQKAYNSYGIKDFSLKSL